MPEWLRPLSSRSYTTNCATTTSSHSVVSTTSGPLGRVLARSTTPCEPPLSPMLLVDNVEPRGLVLPPMNLSKKKTTTCESVTRLTTLQPSEFPPPTHTSANRRKEFSLFKNHFETLYFRGTNSILRVKLSM
jgi:hypothetical protein